MSGVLLLSQKKPAGLRLIEKELIGACHFRSVDGISEDAQCCTNLWANGTPSNKESDNALVQGTTYNQPMGIYSKKYKKIEVKEGSCEWPWPS